MPGKACWGESTREEALVSQIYLIFLLKIMGTTQIDYSEKKGDRKKENIKFEELVFDDNNYPWLPTAIFYKWEKWDFSIKYKVFVKRFL